MKLLLRLFVIVAVIGLTTIPSLAASLEKGQILARKCSVCHGKNGMARDREVPNLAGQSAFYLEKTMKDFRGGIRKDRRMSLIIKTLSDDDIKHLAAWFSTFVVTVQRPE